MLRAIRSVVGAAAILFGGALLAQPPKEGAQADGYFTAHFVSSANQRQAITAVEISIVFQVLVITELQHFDGIGASGCDQRRRFAVRVRKMRDDNGSTLCMSRIGPR